MPAYPFQHNRAPIHCSVSLAARVTKMLLTHQAEENRTQRIELAMPTKFGMKATKQLASKCKASGKCRSCE